MPTCTCFLAEVRMAHLERHLSAKYIKLNRSFSKFVYYTRLSTKLTKIFVLTSQLFLQRAVENWEKTLKSALRRFYTKKIKNFANHILFMSALKIDQSLLIWPFYTYVDFFWFSRYKFRKILTVLYNSTSNFSAAKCVT